MSNLDGAVKQCPKALRAAHGLVKRMKAAPLAALSFVVPHYDFVAHSDRPQMELVELAAIRAAGVL